MPYNEKLADRIRQKLADLQNVSEKPMMGGLSFMYNDKMCVGIIKDDLMCRIDPDLHESAVEKVGCRTMDLGHLYQPHSMTKQILTGFLLKKTYAILRYFSIT